MKFQFKSTPFIDLLRGSREEVVIKKHENLLKVLDACQVASKDCLEDASSLTQLEMVLNAKSPLLGTKVQVKPILINKSEESSKVDKVQLIIKWGGEFTHSGLHHTRDFGENLRKDLSIINKHLLEDVKVFTSSERRVIATADTFCCAFLNTKDLDPQFIRVAKEMLDDSNAAKDLMEQVKSRLRDILNPETNTMTPSEIIVPSSMSSPAEAVSQVMSILSQLRSVMRTNFENLDIDSLQKRWCCNESALLFKERWEKLFKDFCDVERSCFDTSKISELHDSLKYDFLHNRNFVLNIFSTKDSGTSLLRDLYTKSEIIFTCLGPHEYGITNHEKLDVGMMNSLYLLRQLVEELQTARDSDKPITRLFFTKESKIMCLLNIVLLCGLDCHITPVQVKELDYLTQITFELYERKGASTQDREYSLRIGFSPGAHDDNLIDLTLDSKHSLAVAPRHFISHHIPLMDALNKLAPKNVSLLTLTTLKSVASESEEGLYVNIQ